MGLCFTARVKRGLSEGNLMEALIRKSHECQGREAESFQKIQIRKRSKVKPHISRTPMTTKVAVSGNNKCLYNTPTIYCFVLKP